MNTVEQCYATKLLKFFDNFFVFLLILFIQNMEKQLLSNVEDRDKLIASLLEKLSDKEREINVNRIKAMNQTFKVFFSLEIA